MWNLRLSILFLQKLKKLHLLSVWFFFYKKILPPPPKNIKQKKTWGEQHLFDRGRAWYKEGKNSTISQINIWSAHILDTTLHSTPHTYMCACTHTNILCTQTRRPTENRSDSGTSKMLKVRNKTTSNMHSFISMLNKMGQVRTQNNSFHNYTFTRRLLKQ